jgi:hypothetical protein
MASTTEERNIAFKHTLDVLGERTDRQWFEESFGTRHAIVGPEIWTQKPAFNAAASAVSSGLALEEVNFELTLDPFSAGTTWFAKTNPGVWPYSGPLTDFTQLASERVQNWISPVVFGPSSATGYSFLLRQGNGTPIPTGSWELRFVEGVLHLDEGQTAVDKGWVSPLLLTAYRYTGPLGLGASGALLPIVHHTPTGSSQLVVWGDGPIHEVDLGSATGDVAMTLSNPLESMIYRIIVEQGATPRNMTWPSNVVWVGSGGGPPFISPGDGTINLVSLLYDGSNYIAWVDQPTETIDGLRANCLAGDTVGAAVYARGPSVGGMYQVSTADPRNQAKMPALGVIVAKESATVCRIQIQGEVKSIYTSLAVNKMMFVGVGGQLSLNPPVALGGGYALVQSMGVSADTNAVLLGQGPSMVQVWG